MPHRSVHTLFTVLWLSGCSPGDPGPPDGGPPSVLEAVTAQQMGLHYGESAELEVRLRYDDEAHTPLGGVVVRWSFVPGVGDDPGSTVLSQDRTVTDAAGVARVRITAGSEERAFRVRAVTDAGAAVEFAVAVSKQDFVALDVALVWKEGITIATLSARVYSDRRCDALRPTPVAPPALVEVSQPTLDSATLRFTNLLSRDYALLTRAEDSSGHLVGQGCLDLAAGILPPGARLTIPAPLEAVIAQLAGSYDLASAITLSPAAASALTDPFEMLTDCPLSPADDLLDAMVLPPAVAAAVAARRGAPDMNGCRPLTAAGNPSLDAQLYSLLTPAGSPGAQLGTILVELGTIAKSFRLTSRLDVAAAGEAAFTGTHALETLNLGKGGGQDVTYDLPAAGWPVVEARPLALWFDGATLHVDTHGFTLGHAELVGRAFGELSLAPRLGGAVPATPRGLVGAVVGAAMRPSKTGCMAVEDLICTVTAAPGCTGNLSAPCTTALDDLAAPLAAALTTPPGEDLVLTGQVVAFDSDGDLVIDRLQPGIWTWSSAQSAPFSGARK